MNYISESARPPIRWLRVGYQAPTKRILQDWQTVIYVMLIMASHDLLVDEYVDEVLQLKDGQIVA
jgi:energy-coupling factor transporter ATP-binding protein EcfA2